MSKKPRKIEETPASYVSKKSTPKASAPKLADSGVRRMDKATFQKSADKVFRVHHELLRKLAQ
jgi:hypothetical protein